MYPPALSLHLSLPPSTGMDIGRRTRRREGVLRKYATGLIDLVLQFQSCLVFATVHDRGSIFTFFWEIGAYVQREREREVWPDLTDSDGLAD